MCAQLLHSLITHNDKIQGIVINNVKHVICQFADDTNLFLKHEQETLQQVIRTLEIIETNLGLTVNYDKTTLYRIGSIHNSNAKLYTTKPFIWSNAPPSVLGVEISMYSDKQILSSSFKELIDRSEAIFSQWQHRQLSLSGKVLVVNTLIASLFVYKMSVLPNMPYSLIERFERVVKDFLSDGKRLRISFDILKADRTEGGLRLVDLFKRQMALKTQWIVKIIHDPTWAGIAYAWLIPDISENIWKCNLSHNDIDLIGIPHSFWKQVLYAWCMYNFSDPLESDMIAGQIIWLNSFIRIANKPIINIKAWKNSIVTITDLLNSYGILASYQEITIKFGNVLSWYEHIQILAAIPHSWKEAILNADPASPNVFMHFDRISSCNKISNIVYDKLIESPLASQKASHKWSNRLHINISVKEMNKMFANILKPTICTKFRDFQYRLMHNAIVTNRQLYLWKISATDLCSFCHAEMEHTLHLFIQCEQTSQIWEDIKNYIQTNSNQDITSILDWSDKNIIFNMVHPKPAHVINFIVLITKQYIYRARCMLLQLNSTQLLREIEAIEKTERYIAKDKTKLRKHHEKWSQLYSDIQILDEQENYIEMYINDK